MTTLQQPKLTTRKVWLLGAASSVAASVINVAVAGIAVSLLDVASEFLPLQPGPVLTATIFGVLAGTAVYAILNRLMASPTLAFSIIASMVALASLIMPFGLISDLWSALAGTTTEAALALIPLHLIPAAVLIIALVSASASRGPRLQT